MGGRAKQMFLILAFEAVDKSFAFSMAVHSYIHDIKRQLVNLIHRRGIINSFIAFIDVLYITHV